MKYIPLGEAHGKPIEQVRAIRDEVKRLVAELIAAEGCGAPVALMRQAGR